ncbi:hypothetical protein [Paraburkholderia strydomiana]|uniref:hypothetical protein n=1 Tax=Paraburkholderia strydomiana TaxID=1245417 RepID=UPI001BE58AF4|nr:hypothetical protein [Paraburkholderia strydomiana]MBT2792644.1 hypothetical protein [Paraburkholderia strydomiana]
MSTRPNANLSRLAVGQVALQDVCARSTVVAVEGDLQLAFRDHSLAWLGDAVPLTSVTLHEGQCFVVRQHGMVWISAADARAAAFVVQPSLAENRGSSATGRTLLWLAAFLKATLRRAA